MAKAVASVWSSLLSAGLYKKNQGKLTRQLTAGTAVAVIGAGCYLLSQGTLADEAAGVRIGVPLAIVAIGAWAAFRLVNHPPFADFLVAVEAEMDKVSWPAKTELYRATTVVIAVMFLLAGVLFLFDQIWQFFFRLIGILNF
ncbi:MAG: preprotein translocase subunit SecE [Planctomycetota bacterium]